MVFLLQFVLNQYLKLIYIQNIPIPCQGFSNKNFVLAFLGCGKSLNDRVALPWFYMQPDMRKVGEKKGRTKSHFSCQQEFHALEIEFSTTL